MIKKLHNCNIKFGSWFIYVSMWRTHPLLAGKGWLNLSFLLTVLSDFGLEIFCEMYSDALDRDDAVLDRKMPVKHS